MNSLFPPLSNPSAILSATDPTADLIWSRNLKLLKKGLTRVISYTILYNSLASCQISRSSNLQTFIEKNFKSFAFGVPGSANRVPGAGFRVTRAAFNARPSTWNSQRGTFLTRNLFHAQLGTLSPRNAELSIYKCL